MSIHRVLLIMGRDLREFRRDRLWIVFFPAALIFMVLFYRLMPDNLMGSIVSGVYPPAVADIIPIESGSGFHLVGYPTEDSLRSSVEEGDHLHLGLVFHGVFPLAVDSVDLFLSSSLTPFQSRVAESALREIVIALEALRTGKNPMTELPVNVGGIQQSALQAGSVKKGFRPVLLFIVLVVESLAAAGLVSVDVRGGTTRAILVTPASAMDILLAKSATGMILALLQGVPFLLLTGGFGENPAAVVPVVFVGALLSSSLGMIAGSRGKDFTGTLFFSLLLLIPMLIPAFSVLLRTVSPVYIRLIPSWGVVSALRVSMLCPETGSFYLLALLMSTGWILVFGATAFSLLGKKMRCE